MPGQAVWLLRHTLSMVPLCQLLLPPLLALKAFDRDRSSSVTLLSTTERPYDVTNVCFGGFSTFPAAMSFAKPICVARDLLKCLQNMQFKCYVLLTSCARQDTKMAYSLVYSWSSKVDVHLLQFPVDCCLLWIA